jgi:hypothetical protein
MSTIVMLCLGSQIACGSTIYADVNGQTTPVYSFSQPVSSIAYVSPYWYGLSAVPEPSTIVLFGIGAVSMMAYAWRKRRRTA